MKQLCGPKSFRNKDNTKDIDIPCIVPASSQLARNISLQTACLVLLYTCLSHLSMLCINSLEPTSTVVSMIVGMARLQDDVSKVMINNSAPMPRLGARFISIYTLLSTYLTSDIILEHALDNKKAESKGGKSATT